jgi:hypothetical protein
MPRTFTHFLLYLALNFIPEKNSFGYGALSFSSSHQNDIVYSIRRASDKLKKGNSTHRTFQIQQDNKKQTLSKITPLFINSSNCICGDVFIANNVYRKMLIK